MFVGKDHCGKIYTSLCDNNSSFTVTAPDPNQLPPSCPNKGGNKGAHRSPSHVLEGKREQEGLFKNFLTSDANKNIITSAKKKK